MYRFCGYGRSIYSDCSSLSRQSSSSKVWSESHDPIVLTRYPIHGVRIKLPVEEVLTVCHGRSLYLRSDAELNARRQNQEWELVVDNVITFRWRSGTREISYEELDHGSHQRLSFWFMHIVLPFYLSLEESTQILHASGIQIGDGAVLFIGPTYGGKSTLARSFYDQGFLWMADDKIAIYLRDGQYFAAPSLPFSRPFRENETLGEPVDRFADGPLPLTAIFSLEKKDEALHLAAESLVGAEKYACLLASHVFGFSFQRVARFQWLARLADRVAVFKVIRPWGLDKLDETRDLVRTACASVDAKDSTQCPPRAPGSTVDLALA